MSSSNPHILEEIKDENSNFLSLMKSYLNKDKNKEHDLSQDLSKYLNPTDSKNVAINTDCTFDDCDTSTIFDSKDAFQKSSNLNKFHYYDFQGINYFMFPLYGIQEKSTQTIDHRFSFLINCSSQTNIPKTTIFKQILKGKLNKKNKMNKKNRIKANKTNSKLNIKTEENPTNLLNKNHFNENRMLSKSSIYSNIHLISHSLQDIFDQDNKIFKEG